MSSIKFCENCGNLIRSRNGYCPCTPKESKKIDLIPKIISSEIRIEIDGEVIDVHPDIKKKYQDKEKAEALKNAQSGDYNLLYKIAKREFNDIITRKR